MGRLSVVVFVLFSFACGMQQKSLNGDSSYIPANNESAKTVNTASGSTVTKTTTSQNTNKSNNSASNGSGATQSPSTSDTVECSAPAPNDEAENYRRAIRAQYLKVAADTISNLKFSFEGSQCNIGAQLTVTNGQIAEAVIKTALANVGEKLKACIINRDKQMTVAEVRDLERQFDLAAGHDSLGVCDVDSDCQRFYPFESRCRTDGDLTSLITHGAEALKIHDGLKFTVMGSAIEANLKVARYNYDQTMFVAKYKPANCPAPAQVEVKCVQNICKKLPL